MQLRQKRGVCLVRPAVGAIRVERLRITDISHNVALFSERLCKTIHVDTQYSGGRSSRCSICSAVLFARFFYHLIQPFFPTVRPLGRSLALPLEPMMDRARRLGQNLRHAIVLRCYQDQTSCSSNWK